MKNCSGLAGLIFGHAFEARYDERAEPAPEIVMQSPLFTLPESVSSERMRNAYANLEEALAAATKREVIYRCDVCTRCGLIGYNFQGEAA